MWLASCCQTFTFSITLTPQQPSSFVVRTPCVIWPLVTRVLIAMSPLCGFSWFTIMLYLFLFHSYKASGSQTLVHSRISWGYLLKCRFLGPEILNQWSEGRVQASVPSPSFWCKWYREDALRNKSCLRLSPLYLLGERIWKIWHSDLNGHDSKSITVLFPTFERQYGTLVDSIGAALNLSFAVLSHIRF